MILSNIFHFSDCWTSNQAFCNTLKTENFNTSHARIEQAFSSFSLYCLFQMAYRYNTNLPDTDGMGPLNNLHSFMSKIFKFPLIIRVTYWNGPALQLWDIYTSRLIYSVSYIYSKEFRVHIGFHQRSVFSILFFIIILQVITEFKTGCLWVLMTLL